MVSLSLFICPHLQPQPWPLHLSTVCSLVDSTEAVEDRSQA